MIDRPTFSESWYRVATLKPRLRSVVQIYRQDYRGRTWHVVQDPSNNLYFRIDDAAYHFIGLLDGSRTVAQVWDLCNEQLGDHAPTQGEAIQLLGQLYTSNLLQGDLPADASGMFDRAKKRMRRQVGGFFMNLLFIRVPIFDPDRFLDRWIKLVGWVFTPVGLALWLLVVGFGLWSLAGHTDELFSNAQGVLSPDNLVLLYLSFAVIKAIHEFGHGFACKHFGLKSGGGGEVHVLGIMLMIFTPVPYVDASSAWALRSKWQRAVIGAAGMYVELFVAAIAAVIWTRSAGNPTMHALAYNAMFVASVSTILFNANPLLRYDGYYILSDLLEIPNLAQRSKEYIQHLVKRYVFGVRRSESKVQTLRERVWLFNYGILSGIYRVFVSVAILFFVADKVFIVGAILAIGAVIGWVVKPVFKFLHYLTASDELQRTRGRALAASGGFAVAVALLVGVLPVPDWGRAEGVIEPRRMAIVHVESDGFVRGVLASGSSVAPGGEPLIVGENLALEVQRDRLVAQKKLTEARQRAASVDEIAVAQSLTDAIHALDEQIARAEVDLARLQPTAPFAGRWICPDDRGLTGAYLPRGQAVGMVVSDDDLIVRAIADQTLGPRIDFEVGRGAHVELRVKGRPDLAFDGVIEKVLPAGQDQLPSAALGYFAGGSMAVKMSDQEGTQAAEPFFEVRIQPDAAAAARLGLATGQRVMVRFTSTSKPIAEQALRAVRQMIQKRFAR